MRTMSDGSRRQNRHIDLALGFHQGATRKPFHSGYSKLTIRTEFYLNRDLNPHLSTFYYMHSYRNNYQGFINYE